MPDFELISDFVPTGDQPQAIERLSRAVTAGRKHQALLGVTGSGKSVIASTPIMVRRGTQMSCGPIGPMIDDLLAARSEEVQGVGETDLLEPRPLDEPVEVFSIDPHTGRASWKSVRQFLRHRSPERLSRVTTQCGRRVTVTGDHNFFVLRQGLLELVRTDEIRPGDYLPIPRNLPEPAEPLGTLILDEHLPTHERVYVSLADFEKPWVAHRAELLPLMSRRQAFGAAKLQERVPLETDHRLVRAVPTIAAGATFDSIKRTYSALAEVPITPRLMGLLGYYIAEGHAEQNYFVLSSAEESIVADLREAVIELGLHVRHRPATYDYQVSSSFWTSLISRWCGRDARSKRLPSFWPRLSNASLAQLLRAYFAADGGVEGVQVTCVTVSEQLASDLTYALLRFGIVGRTNRRLKRLPGRDERGEYWQVSISGKEFLEKFEQAIGFALPRQNQRLAEIMAPSGNTNDDVIPLDGCALRSVRKRLGMWQRTLADRAGCTRSLLSLIEGGHRRPSRTLAEHLVAALRDEARLQQNHSTLQTVESFAALLGLFWTPVETVEWAPGERHVYDVAVADNETFLAGSGGLFVHNTFTMANVVQQIQRPTLVMAHNKTLAAQLASEFKEFFPNNAVEYFVSYYDYYQPEAYMPRTDTYIEKDTLVNEDIERLRHSTMQSLLTRRDVLVVASVSCIYGLGDPEEYGQSSVSLRVGETYKRDKILRRLTDIYYERNDYDLGAGKFRVRGDTLEVHPSSQEIVVRISFWGDEVERITEVDPLTGEVLADRASVEIYPARYFVTSRQKLEAALHDIAAEMEEQVALFEAQDKLLEAQRLRQRTQYDLEMLSETGFCSGVENYSRHLSRREAGSTPWTLMDYFPDDFVAFIDESHMTIPQVRGMFNGDRARKDVLVEFGFRLPSALDNRPLMFNEFEERLGQTIYVSATPGPYEYTVSRVDHSAGTPDSPTFWVPDWERRLAPPRPSASQTAADSELSSAGKIASAVARVKDGTRGDHDPLANGHATIPPAHEDEAHGPMIEVYGAEQLIRPTGLLDPEIEVKPTRGQIDDLMEQIARRTARAERVLVTTLTKRMAEDLADFLREANVKVHYLHSEVDTLERVEILRDLRLGVYDVVVGINLLREGLDLPEVSLVAILDADKEGYLRSNSSLIQTIGRAARHVDGHVIMYADQLTESMRRAIDETYRRRAKQQAYNEAHGITPMGIRKAIRDITERVKAVAKANASTAGVTSAADLPKDELFRLIKDLEAQMKEASRALEFERAALLRDQIIELKRTLAVVEEPNRIVPQEFVRPQNRKSKSGQQAG